MGLFARMMGVSREKEALIRGLLKDRVADDPDAVAFGQGPEVADKISGMALLGMPEATIVTCVETWAQFKSQGLTEAQVVAEIAKHRGLQLNDTDMQSAIIRIVLREHGHAGNLPTLHILRCIQEAKKMYGIG